jgi:hypothetical protein
MEDTEESNILKISPPILYPIFWIDLQTMPLLLHELIAVQNPYVIPYNLVAVHACNQTG